MMELTSSESRGHAHFVSFSCYKRRRLLEDDHAKGIVVHFLAAELAKANGSCMGFVVMPDHVHALLRFTGQGNLSRFIQQWKRKSSHEIKRFFGHHFPAYTARIDPGEPVWQRGFYTFDVFSPDKATEKLEYMHNNPVRKGLVESARQWRYGSARWYLLNQPVGIQIVPLK